MENQAAPIEYDAPVEDSRIIDTDIDGVKSGGGKPAPEAPQEKTPAEPRKPESARDSLEAEAKKLAASGKEDDDQDDDDDGDKTEAKDKVAKPKDEAAKTSEAKAEDKSGQEAKTPKPSEGRKIIEAPARLLPQNRELWKGVAHPIREEWVRREQDFEREVSELREHKVFREELKDFEELSKRHNVPFKEALSNYVDIEKKFSEDPAQGFRQLCQNLGMSPPQAIGHILRSANVTPQQLMEHMQRQPEAYTGLAPSRAQQMSQGQPQQSQQKAPDPEVVALKAQVQAMQAQSLEQQVIRPFAEEYPEYYDHEEQIAKVLQSGIIDQIHGAGLSPRDKLMAALGMVSPGSVVRGSVRSLPVDDDDTTPPAGDLRGAKSIKSSPGAISDNSREPDKKMSMRDMLEEEARKLRRA